VLFKKKTFLTAGIGIFAGIMLFHSALAGNLNDVKRLLKTAHKQAKDITAQVPDNAAAIQAAKKSAKTFASPTYQNMLQEEIARVRAALSPGEKPREPQISQKTKNQDDYLLSDERIYLFISSSIPIKTLKNYAADIDRLNDPRITMVMRGFINGMQKVKPTMQFVRNILNKDPQCDNLAQCPTYHVTINVDPLLFSRYGIDTVPAILYVNGVSSVDPPKSEGLPANTSIADAYIVDGDVSLEYALDIIEQQSHSSQITEILTRMKGFYQ